MRDIRIERANLDQPDHQAAVVAMVDAYARDPAGGGQGLSEPVKAAMVDGLRQFPTAMVFLAFRGDEPVGAAVCFLGFSTFAARPLINVHDLSVKDGFRCKGIGRRLLEAVEAKAREMGCCKVTLEVRVDNEHAEGLYRSQGFDDMDFKGRKVKVLFLEKPIAIDS
ncbi:MAG: GNAT family N-acetyltransferase [Phycisphaeraceae bacterium]|nr:GNAT family N-acetyltransferase [Phycisphaeraceae bacterium]